MKATGIREAFFAVDGQRQVVMWAPGAEAMLGFEAAEALGRPCWQVLKGTDAFGRNLYCDQCRACLQSDASVAPPPHHFLLRNRDGRLMRLVHELVPLPAGPGARALVFLYESPVRQALPAGTIPGAQEVHASSATFAAIVKGLAALGIVADSASGSSFYQTLDSTLDRVLGLTGGEAAEVFLWDRSSGEMCLTAHRGLFRSAFRQITRFQANQGFPGLVAATSTPLLTRDLRQDPRFLRTRVTAKGIQSFISVPLRTDQGIMGCLNVASRRCEDGISSQLQFLSWMAGPLASAAELAILRSQGRVQDLDESEWPDGALPGQVLKAMMDVSEAEQGIINLWQPDGGVACSESSSGDVVPCIGGRDASHCLVYRQAAPVLAPGPGNAWPATCRESLAGARTAICIPIGSHGRAIGAVSLRFLRSLPVPTRPVALIGAMARISGRVLKDYPSLTDTGNRLPDRGGAGVSEPELRFTSATPSASAGGERSTTTSAEAGPSPFLDIRCFGRFQVFADGKLLPPGSFGRRQSFTIFKMLVTRRGRPVSTDFLSEALWPEAGSEATDRRLWVIVHSLRAALEPGLRPGHPSTFVHRIGEAYTFAPGVPYRLDVEDFIASLAQGEEAEGLGNLRAAAAAYQRTAGLYGGDFMEEDQYADWCSAEREYFQELYLDTLKRLASLHASWKEWDRSIAWHRRALLVDSLREEVHRELMRCLRGAGRRDEALRQYMECREILARELDVEPLPETSRLYHEILEEEKRRKAF